MARRQPSGRKRRTREHIIADLSRNFLERKILECGHSVQVRTMDYGIDATMLTYDDNGEVENGLLEFQLKATDHLKLTSAQDAILYKVSTRDLKSWLFEIFPIILIVYDGIGDRAFWLDIQLYPFKIDIDSVERMVSIRIPVTNLVSRAAVQQWRGIKNRVQLETPKRREGNES